MKKSVAKKWVAALRSGKYQQEHGSLKVDNNYCCLGVLCDISGLGKFTRSASGELEFVDKRRNVSQSTITRLVRVWAGMKTDTGEWTDPELGVTSLAECNDGNSPLAPGHKFSFAAIANFIEKHYKIL